MIRTLFITLSAAVAMAATPVAAQPFRNVGGARLNLPQGGPVVANQVSNRTQVTGGGRWTGGSNLNGGGHWTGGGMVNGGHWAGNGNIGGGGRWGGHVQGRWYAGYYAPGGWNAYRRPSRGWRLPSYWFAPSFHVNDYASWGLRTPRPGYTWVRYYDDAVLVDRNGRVDDFSYGVNWDGYAAAGAGGAGGYAYAGDGYAYAEGGAGGSGANYPAPAYGHSESYGYQSSYPGGYAPPVMYAPPAAHVQPLPQTYYGGGYDARSYSSGYYYGAPSTTTVVVTGGSSSSVTEEVIEEVIETTYVSRPRKMVRRVAPKKRVYRKPCDCACYCR